MLINGGGGGGSGSDEDDVMMMMTSTTMRTTKGSRDLWEGGGEGRPTMNVTNIAELQFFYFFQEDPNRFPDL